MSEIRYIGKNGPQPEPRKPTKAQLEKEKADAEFAISRARERAAIAALREDELAKKRGESMSSREVKYVFEMMQIALQQGLLRGAPAKAIINLRSLHLPHEVLHSIRMSLDATFRAELCKADETLTRALKDAHAVYFEMTGQSEPSEKAVAIAARKKARVNMRRRVVRRVKA